MFLIRLYHDYHPKEVDDAVCGNLADVEFKQHCSLDLVSLLGHKVGVQDVVGVFRQRAAPLDHALHSHVMGGPDLVGLYCVQGHIYDLLFAVEGQFFKVFVDLFQKHLSPLHLGLYHGCFIVKEQSIFGLFEPIGEFVITLVAGIVLFKLPVLDVLVFEVVGIVEVDKLPVLVGVEVLGELFPLLIDCGQQFEVGVDLFFPVCDVDGLLECAFPDECALGAVVGDVLDDVVEVLVEAEDLKELDSASEQDFVEGVSLFLHYQLQLVGFDLLEESQVVGVEDEFLEIEAVGGEVPELSYHKLAVVNQSLCGLLSSQGALVQTLQVESNEFVLVLYKRVHPKSAVFAALHYLALGTQAASARVVAQHAHDYVFYFQVRVGLLQQKMQS